MENAAKPEEWGALMRDAQAGDGRAYARLLAAILPLLRAKVRRAVPPGLGLECEDMVQDVLLSLHAVRHTYDPTRPFAPWLMAIAKHRVLDGLRRNRRLRGREIALDFFDETFLGVAAKEEVEGYGDPQALRQAMTGLPEGQRQAIALTKIEGLSLKEASAASGQSVAALKVAVHRGLKALRGVLSKETSRS
jgi:RNA polymerase sigma-70 factor (ECF subfamily)